MIYRLRRKFILISTLSVVGVFTVIFLLISVFSYTSLNRTMDTLTDAISAGRGRFPEPAEKDDDVFDGDPGDPDDGDDEVPPPKKDTKPDVLGGEVRFSTRYFTVRYDSDGRVEAVDTAQIHSVGAQEAIAYAEAVKDGETRGWEENFRYKVYAIDGKTAITFVDGSMNRAQERRFLLNVSAILLGSGAGVLFLIILLSRRAVRPMAESYEKQKQFITDANHELKTPLTLILTNLDIAEAELGQNEWLDDIRTEGRRMAELVGQMVTLCRMDEAQPLDKKEFSLSDTVADTASEFLPLAQETGKRMETDVEPGLVCFGDEGAIRRLLSVLLDNALKYCDPAGEIRVVLCGKRHPTLTVENSFSAVGETDLTRLFDRFYRSDKVRTSGSGSGIGLSIAKAIAGAHRAEISAYQAGVDRIGFRVQFRGRQQVADKRR